MKLLVAALDAELVASEDDLPGFDRLVTGPGKLQATYALTRALDARTYDEILVVGTAGAIDPRLHEAIYDIEAAIQHDVTDIDGIVGQHVSLPARVELGREGVTIATGDHFVDDAEAVGVIAAILIAWFLVNVLFSVLAFIFKLLAVAVVAVIVFFVLRMIFARSDSES